MDRARMTPEQLEADREKNRAGHHRRRAEGRCAGARCDRAPAINPRTGLPFWKCRACRVIQRRRDAVHGARQLRRAA